MISVILFVRFARGPSLWLSSCLRLCLARSTLLPRSWLLRRLLRIPEVSWVRLLLEGMSGFPSPFEGLRTILWDWSHFSVGLYDVKYNPTEKQLVILLSLLLLKKEPPPPGIEPGTIRSEARRSTRWAIEALLEKEWIFKVFIPKTANMQYRYGARSKNWRGGGQSAPWLK